MSELSRFIIIIKNLTDCKFYSLRKILIFRFYLIHVHANEAIMMMVIVNYVYLVIIHVGIALMGKLILVLSVSLTLYTIGFCFK